jgi:uncharacterized membrane protein
MKTSIVSRHKLYDRPERHSERLWELDALRGLAVVLMIVFHLTWDLQFLGLIVVDVFSRPWQIFARGIGSLFIFLLGVSLVLSSARAPSRAPMVRALARDLPAAPAAAAGAAPGAPVAFRTIIISRYRPAQERILDM